MNTDRVISKAWYTKIDIPRAIEVVKNKLTEFYGDAWYDVQLDYIDALGYWFIYNMQNENRIFCCCVCHEDLFFN